MAPRKSPKPVKLLNQYAKDTYSQFGEDGILKKIFQILHPRNPWCVEFGAWDGIAFSNTRALIESDWNAVLIEPNPRKFIELQQNNSRFPKVHLLQEFVMLKGNNHLDSLLERQAVPRNFELLSIDIDGNDYHIWKSLKKYHPKVVVIEFNKTIPPDVSFVQPSDFSLNQGSSLLALVELGKEKQYELICCTEANAIFVQKKLFPQFNIMDNSLEALWKYDSEIRLFQLFDGTLKMLPAENKLLWSGISFTERDIQVVPKLFRHFPEGYWKMGLLFLFRIWKTMWRK